MRWPPIGGEAGGEDEELGLAVMHWNGSDRRALGVKAGGAAPSPRRAQRHSVDLVQRRAGVRAGARGGEPPMRSTPLFVWLLVA
jgi:hypothetical protein